MREKDLARANEIKEEITRIEVFLFSAENVWTGRLIKQTSRYILKSNAYGFFKENEIFLSTDIKNKMLQVLRDHLIELNNEFEAL